MTTSSVPIHTSSATCPYCIPLPCICDGIRDCPDGDDEVGCDHGLSCPGMLKCRNATCVHMSNVCDGEVHCPYGADDEILCDFDFCPDECSCVGPMYNCSKLSLKNLPAIPESVYVLHLIDNDIEINFFTFYDYSSLLVLNLAFNDLRSLPRGSHISGVFMQQTFLINLNLSHNNISVIKSFVFSGLQNLLDLDLEGNIIQTIENFGFWGLLALPQLNLHSQQISHIESNGFVGLASLKNLDLSNNKLTILLENTFTPLVQLIEININLNALQKVSLNIFHSRTRINTLSADISKWCCHVSVLQCKANEEYPKSCGGILQNNFHRVHISVLTFLCLSMNTIVSIKRLKRKSCMNDFLVLNLAIADILNGMYLALLLFSDLYITFMLSYAFSGSFWRSQFICKMAMGLLHISYIMSNNIFFLKSLCFYLAIKFPFEMHRMEWKQHFWVTIFSMWCVTTMLSILISIGNNPNNDMCSLYTSHKH